jgi:hypothetical protein
MPTLLAGVIGIHTMDVSVKSTASATGGSPTPLDVVVIVDTTASMQSSCSSTVAGVTNPSKLDCAKAGVGAQIGQLWPCSPSLSSCGTPDPNGNVPNPLDQVGLMVYPALSNPTSSNIANELDCAANISGPPNIGYPALPAAGYQIVSLRSDFKTSDTSGLNTGSNLVKAIYWSGTGCPNGATAPSNNVYGIEDPGGAGTYFADAITQAQTYLSSDGRTAQKAIILLSDGEANRGGPTNNPNPCHAAINAAHAAAAQGTWVYAIAYESSGNCTDTTTISALSTMQQIACSDTACPDPTKFFQQPNPGDLTQVFKQVANDLTSARLVPDNTQ